MLSFLSPLIINIFSELWAVSDAGISATGDQPRLLKSLLSYDVYLWHLRITLIVGTFQC